MSEQEIEIWRDNLRKLELKLWELIEEEHNVMQDLIMIKGLLEEGKNEQ